MKGWSLTQQVGPLRKYKEWRDRKRKKEFWKRVRRVTKQRWKQTRGSRLQNTEALHTFRSEDGSSLRKRWARAYDDIIMTHTSWREDDFLKRGWRVFSDDEKDLHEDLYEDLYEDLLWRSSWGSSGKHEMIFTEGSSKTGRPLRLKIIWKDLFLSVKVEKRVA